MYRSKRSKYTLGDYRAKTRSVSHEGTVLLIRYEISLDVSDATSQRAEVEVVAKMFKWRVAVGMKLNVCGRRKGRADSQIGRV